jgi:hypothetical protein
MEFGVLKQRESLISVKLPFLLSIIIVCSGGLGKGIYLETGMEIVLCKGGRTVDHSSRIYRWDYF